MEFKTRKLTGATAEITVNNSAEEVEEAYRHAYQKASHKVKIPGFRPGKAPLEMVERKLGDSVSHDAARDLIADTFEEIADSIDPAPISVPKFRVESFDRHKGAVFIGDYDIHPEVKLGKYKKLKVDVDTATVEEKSVEDELKRIRQSHAILHPKEDQPAAAGDLVTVDLELLHDGKRVYQHDDIQFEVGSIEFPPMLNEKVTGMKVEESQKYEVTVPADFQDEKYAGKLIAVEVKIKQVQATELPELNDEFAKEQGEFDTLAAMKQGIHDHFKNMSENVLNQRARDELLKQAVDDTTVEVPETMLEREYEHRLNQVRSRLGDQKLQLPDIARMAGRTTEALQQEFREMATRAVKEALVLQKVAEKEGIEVSDEDVTKNINDRWGSYLSTAQLESFQKNQEIRDEIRGRLLFQKSLDWLFENAERKNGKEITYDALAREGAFS